MSEQERETWYRDGKWVFVFEGREVVCGATNATLAQQIADDHNRIPELEASVVDMRDKVVLERERRVAMEQRAEELQKAGDRMLAALNWQLSRNNQGLAPMLAQIQEFGKVLARGGKDNGNDTYRNEQTR